jgi:O-antigen/teichoic acid export membrane protein
VSEERPQSVAAGLATVTAGTLFLTIATLVLVVFNFLARVLIVRSVSPASWDAFSLGFTLTQVLLAVGTLGIPVAVARSLPIAASEVERRTIVRTALGVGAAAATGSAAALALAAPALGRSLGSPPLGTGLELFALALGSLILATVLAAIFQGFSNVTPNALFVQIVVPGLFLAFLGAALVVPPGRVSYMDALVAYAAACVATLVTMLLYTVWRLPRDVPLRGPGLPSARSKLLLLAVPLFVFGAMASVVGSGDTLVLGAVHYAQVGAYSASLTLARLVQVGVSAASYVFLPVASGFIARGDRRAVGLTYVTVTKWLLVLSVPLFVVFVFLPSASLDFVYGPSYATVVRPLQIVVAGAFVGALLGPGAMAQVAVGQARLLAVNATVAGVADVALALALVPAYGEVGAAVAWASANVLYASLCLAELALAEGYHPFRRHVLVPLGVTCGPVSVLLFLWHPRVPILLLPPLALGLAALFAVSIVATGSVDDGDRLLLGAVERMLGRPLPFVRRWAARLRPARS